MYAHRVLPFLLLAGAVMMIMQHNRRGFMGQCKEREGRGPLGPHGEWEKRVPPLVEKWHQRMHEQEAQAAAI